MIIVACAVIVLAVAFYCAWDDYYFVATFLLTCVAGTFASAFVVMPFIFARSDTVVHTEPLAALNDTSSVNGSFFLGTGTVDEDPVFFYYSETPDGFKLQNEEADDVSIRYTDKDPYMEYECSVTPESNWVDFGWFSGGEFDCKIDNFVFYVPKGSINNSYELDAQ